jgi:hypothetical protein
MLQWITALGLGASVMNDMDREFGKEAAAKRMTEMTFDQEIGRIARRRNSDGRGIHDQENRAPGAPLI